MENMQDLIKCFIDLGEKAFLEKYNQPFLIFPEKHGSKGFSTYHTKMADRGTGSYLGATNEDIKDFLVLTPKAAPDGSAKKKLIIGRGEERDLEIEHSTVSKRHAFISFDEEKKSYKIGDAGSTNGTFVNGQPIESGDPVYIRDGNIVSFGDCDYLFFSPNGMAGLLKSLASGQGKVAG